MQLVAYGAQDVYLTGEPKITFFKKLYSRYTSFATEAIKLTIQGTIGNGNTIQVVVGRDADLIQDMWVELTPLASAPPAWVAERAFKSIELDIGGQRIDKHYKTWFRLYAEVFLPESKKLSYGKLTSLGNSVADTSAPNNVSLPLLFFFNRDPGLALPLVALQYHEVRIVFELANDFLTYFSQNYFVFWGNYIYLDSLERKLFSTKEHDYLIDQVQHTGGELIGSGILNPSFRLPFQHPVKELIWCFKNATALPTTFYNFTTDTSNVNVSILQQSNVSAPHTYGSPVLTLPTSFVPDSGLLFPGTTNTKLSGNVVSVSSTGTIALVSATGVNSAGSPISPAISSANVYRNIGGVWFGPTSLPAKRSVNAGANMSFSSALSPDGIYAATGDASLASSVYTTCNVFSYNGVTNTWQDYSSYTQSSLNTSGFNSLALSAQTAAGYPILAAGCVDGSSSSGAGSVCVGLSKTIAATNIDSGGNAKLSDGKTGTKLGTSVAISYDGTLIAGGAPGSGNVAVFYNPGTWVTTSNPTSNISGSITGLFGSSVSLSGSGSTIAIGAPGGAAGGSAQVYTSSGATLGSSWTLAATFSATNSGDLFGSSVALNPTGTSLVVGAPGSNYVTLYTQSANVWNTTGTVYSGTTGSLFGRSVSSSAINFIVGAPFTSTTTGNYIQAYSGPVPITTYKTWVEDGAQTSTLAVGPLSSLNLDLNGQSRFYPQSGKYFNQYQPYRYHMGSPYPGIYSYSFALNPEMHQPSGSCNFSRIDNSQINIILKNSMYTPCYLSLFAVNYNLFRVKSGMGGLVFAN